VSAFHRRARVGLFAVALAAALLAPWTATGCARRDVAPATGPAGGVAVHFVDVGQGDCVLIRAGSQFAIVDGGPRDAADRVVEYLHGVGVERLELAVATHPHEDHIGALPALFAEFPPALVVDSGRPHTTRIYEEYLDAVEESGADYDVAQAGRRFEFDNGATLEFLAPFEQLSEEVGADLNNSSVVIRLVYGGVRLLLTGDIEREAEEMLVRVAEEQLAAEVLKVPHHGSRTSSSQLFLDAVGAEVSVICVGADNDYGHPSDDVLTRLESAGVRVYRTDRDGTVVITTDGRGYSVWTEKAGTASRAPRAA